MVGLEYLKADISSIYITAWAMKVEFVSHWIFWRKPICTRYFFDSIEITINCSMDLIILNNFWLAKQLLQVRWLITVHYTKLL